MASDERYKIYHRYLKKGEAHDIAETVGRIIKRNPYETKGWRVPFVQGGLIFGDNCIYLGYPIAFPVSDDDAKQAIDAFGKRKINVKGPMFDYYSQIVFFSFNRDYLGCSVSRFPIRMIICKGFDRNTLTGNRSRLAMCLYLADRHAANWLIHMSKNSAEKHMCP